jgi:hypothetical protein
MVKIGRSVSLPEYTTQKNHLLHSSVVDGQAYSWTNATYNYDAADTILAVQNTSTTQNLHIDQIWCHGDTTTRVIVHATSEDGFTIAGTTVTGVNLNRASSNTASATAKADETGNTQGNILWAGSIPSDNATPVAIGLGVILDLNDVIAVDFTDDGGEALVTIIGHYENA